MRRITLLVAAALLNAALGAAAFAQLPPVPTGPQYQVELLVFAHVPGAVAVTEDFLADPDVPPIVQLPPRDIPPPPWGNLDPAVAMDEAVEQAAAEAAARAAQADEPALEPSSDEEEVLEEVLVDWSLLEAAPEIHVPAFRRIVDPAQLSLSDVYRRLGNLPAYRQVAHIGWLQRSDLPPNESVVVELDGTADSRVLGTVRLATGTTLSLHLDVEYVAEDALVPRVPVALGGSPSWTAQIPRYRLQEQRGVRLGDLHYFDHPAFGVIAVVRRAD